MWQQQSAPRPPGAQCSPPRMLPCAASAMQGAPFYWTPADPQSSRPPTLLLSCSELGVQGVDATMGIRTGDGYRMGVSNRCACC